MSLGASNDDSVVKRISREDIRLIYSFEEMVGEGSFGTVRIAHKINNPDKQFAIKSIPRQKVEKNKSSLSDLEHELDILISVDHPYIAKFYEVFLDHKYVHLVMEYCNDGDLYEELKKKVWMKEDDVKRIVR